MLRQDESLRIPVSAAGVETVESHTFAVVPQIPRCADFPNGADEPVRLKLSGKKHTSLNVRGNVYW